MVIEPWAFCHVRIVCMGVVEQGIYIFEDNKCITTLLCMLVWRLFMSLCVQHDSKWRQLSFFFTLHK